MRYVRFGRSNVQVPVISLGTWGHGGSRISADGGASVGWSGSDDSQVKEALVRAFARGITHWDTADVYGDGHAEDLIGGVWDRVPREQIFLATKVGWDTAGYGHWYHPKMMRERLERSLRLLRTEVIDLHYLHHCDFGANDEYFDDAVSSMRRFREEGKVRFIGLSDWDAAKIARFVERVDPDVVQPYRNVVDDDYESSGLKRLVDERDLGVAFFSPLKHGLLLGKYDAPQEFPEGDFRRNVADFRDREAIMRYQRAATKLREMYADRTEPVLQGVLGALLADAPTACVLVGQRSARQVESAAAAAETAVTASEAEMIRTLYTGR